MKNRKVYVITLIILLIVSIMLLLNNIHVNEVSGILYVNEKNENSISVSYISEQDEIEIIVQNQNVLNLINSNKKYQITFYQKLFSNQNYLKYINESQLAQ